MAINALELLIKASATGFSSVSKEIGGLEKQFKSLQSTAAGALAFAGIGLGATEIIQIADAYGQMSGRLKLVTQYTGDFSESMAMLRNSARETRSDLPATVQLYTQLAPALKGIGKSAQESVGIVTTINQAIGLSGSSAQAAEAALVQLGQGFASGALRGEELNSIMEQTPALAQAIADGLGVSRGALRELGSEGKLTAEAVAGALERVAAQVAGDFSKMPVTVGQAMTNLRNEFLVFTGVTDQASGGTSALASTINAVATEFKDAGPAVTAFSFAIKTMINGLDGAYRMLKIVGIGLAGYAAAAMEALSGNFSGAKQIWSDLGKDIDAVLQKPLAGQAVALDAAADSARKRQQLEKQLADEVIKLEKLKAYVAGTESDNVVGKEKANIDNRIKEQQRLVDAVRKAWKETLDEAEKYATAARDKLAKATSFRESGKTSAFEAGLKGLSPDEQLAAKAQRMTELQGQGSYEAARARLAAIEGDVKKYDAAAAVAERRLTEALQLAKDIGDATSVESISEELAKNQEAGAKLDTKKSEAAKAKADEQLVIIAKLAADLTALEERARSIEVAVDVTKAESAIAGLQSQLAELAKGVVVPVTVATPATPAAATADAPAYASGGLIRGPGSGTSDSILARVSNQEYIVRAAAVRHYGAGLLSRINNMQIPKFSHGGLVGASGSSSGGGSPLILDFGKLGRFNATASTDTAKEIEKVFKRASLSYGRR